MRILYITDNDINGHGGGCLGSRKYYTAIRNSANYLSAEFRTISMGQNVPEALKEVEFIKNRKLDREARLHAHSTFMYFMWEKNKKEILDFNPDILFLGRTRLGFIAKAFKKLIPSCKVISFVDNVEYDYVNSYFSKGSYIKNAVFKIIERNVVKRDESDAIKYSDKLVYLTMRDVKRCESLYSFTEKSPTILPVCLECVQNLRLHSDKKTIAFVGSLNYGANLAAVKILIRDIWLPFFSENKNVQLVIAGSHPDSSLKLLTTLAANIHLIEDFNKLEDFLPRNSLMIAPIPNGAGMKVKVAETLSLGLPIVASDEALVGYEEALDADILCGIKRANTVLEYVQVIKNFENMTNEAMINILEQNKMIFHKYYDFNRAYKTIKKILENI